MRALQKLTQKGNAFGFSVPKQMLVYLGWLPGECFVIELTDDRSVLIRRQTARDIAPIGPPRILDRELPTVPK